MKLQFAVINHVVKIDAVAFVNTVVDFNVNAVAVINDAAVAVVKYCCSCL